MGDLKNHLHKLFGREPSQMELKAFSCFDTDTADRKKRFRRYSESRPLYLNIDDEHFIYISHHTSRLRCKLDMATRHLDSTLCYKHDGGSIMLGIAHAEKNRRMRSVEIPYRIFVQNAGNIDENLLHAVSEFADHMQLIRDESPWERLCRTCVTTNTGGHITASAQRLFINYANGLLYFVPDHLNLSFRKTAEAFEQQPHFIGKTVPYPILSLDNEDGLLEIPITTLRLLQESMQKYMENRTPYRENINNTPLPEINAASKKSMDKLVAYLKNEAEENPSQTYTVSDKIPELQIDPFPLKGLAFNENGIELHTLAAIVDLYAQGLIPLALTYYMESSVSVPRKLDQLLSSINKNAKLFEIPIANSCVVPGERNRLKLFFISKFSDQRIPQTFQDPGDFICLLGDPSGTVRGSAYADATGIKSRYSPPGVMRGTIAALINVLDECKNKGILSSVNPIQRGGLFAALYKACGSGLGAAVYSERKSPESVLFSESLRRHF
ncbi:MAG: hypothetical protein U5N56_04190 [Candidatus Marinimicrobia bacterium]|nr:hypothetical protein [Candidatus Neomarinimicrobiota bacterium]